MKDQQTPDVPTILVVDDEAENADAVRRALGVRGNCKVVIAFSASEALAFLRANAVDLLLVDQRMPGMSGTELVMKMHKLGYLAPCIVVTAFPEDEAVALVRTSGLAQCVVAKPWRADELLLAVEFALTIGRSGKPPSPR